MKHAIVRRTEVGRTEILVPEVGLGTWDYYAGPRPLRERLRAGAWFIHSAESYGSEVMVGEASRGLGD